MRQSLVNNFEINCNCPKVNTIEQDTQQDVGPSRQSPRPSNWSDYLHVENDTNNEGQDQTEPLLKLTLTNLLLQEAYVYLKTHMQTYPLF